MIPQRLVLGAFIIAWTTGCSDNVISDINLSPQATILSHSDGDFLPVGVETLFLGQVTDEDNPFEDLLAIWYLNDQVLCPFGPVEADGTTRCATTGTEGTHQIRLQVSDDEGGWGDDQVQLLAQPTVCDGSPAWSDPYTDGSLRLFDSESYGFDGEAHAFSFACVQDEAHINVCEAATTLVLDSGMATTVGGNGFTPLGGQDVRLHIASEGAEPIFILVDATESSFTVSFDTPNAPVTLTSKGTYPLFVDTVTCVKFTAAVGGDYTQIGPLTVTGLLTVDAAGAVIVDAPITAGGQEGEVNTMSAGSSIPTPLEAPVCP